jgi:hypothetical protein
MHEPGVPDLLVIFRRHYPAGTAHIGGAEQARKIEKRLLEVEAHCVVAGNLHTLGVVMHHVAPGAAIMLKAPFDVRRRHRAAVVKFDPGTKLEGGTLAVLGKIVAFGERRIFLARLAQVVDQRVGAAP